MVTARETNCLSRNVLIVGGGPAGLATALMLAKQGCTKIAVLEKRPAADYYEPDKSFNYLIDGRGQKLTDWLGLTEQISNIGVPSTEFYLTLIKSKGSRKTFKVPIADPKRKTAYWVTRRAFVLLLYQEIERNWQHCITVLFNTKCSEISKLADEEKIQVIAETDNNHLVKFEPDLLIGCDGFNSSVRNALKEWDDSGSDRFEMNFLPSPSAGLRYKVLSLPPNFPLDLSGKERANCVMAYAIRGAFRGRKQAVSLGLLPLKNPDQPRSANIITWPDHKIWELKSSQEVYNFLEKSFPQLPISQILSPEEAERFAKSEGGKFPTPQYCSRLYFVGSSIGAASAVMLGDAIHCFPPDIGQGVNSALEDVFVLKEALTKSNSDLSVALPLYESWRFPDVKALVRLAQIAFPWQYNQAPFRKMLWNVNFFFRLLLSRLLPYIFSRPAFLLIQNHELSYQEILGKAERTTQNILLLGLMLICGFLAVVIFRLQAPNFWGFN